MSIDLRTALIIKNNKVRIQAGGPAKGNGKYVGWIMQDVDRWAPLLNTNPIYDSAEEAKQFMQNLVNYIREKEDLPTVDEIMDKFMMPKEKKVVKKNKKVNTEVDRKKAARKNRNELKRDAKGKFSKPSLK